MGLNLSKKTLRNFKKRPKMKEVTPMNQKIVKNLN
jgi:hypothetical protein